MKLFGNDLLSILMPISLEVFTKVYSTIQEILTTIPLTSNIYLLILNILQNDLIKLTKMEGSMVHLIVLHQLMDQLDSHYILAQNYSILQQGQCGDLAKTILIK